MPTQSTSTLCRHFLPHLSCLWLVSVSLAQLLKSEIDQWQQLGSWGWEGWVGKQASHAFCSHDRVCDSGAGSVFVWLVILFSMSFSSLSYDDWLHCCFCNITQTFTAQSIFPHIPGLFCKAGLISFCADLCWAEQSTNLCSCLTVSAIAASKIYERQALE